MITFVTSATGGHIYPAIACAQELTDTKESVQFISINSTTGSRIIERYGFICKTVAAFRKKKWLIFLSFWQTYTHLKHTNCKVLVLCGGYLCIPAGIIGIILKIPIVILEQNILPGRANRLFSRFSTYFCSSFNETQRYIKKTCTLTGNPVRKRFLTDDISDSIMNEHWPKTRILGIFGGSQGAQFINEWTQKHYLQFETHSICLFHITGLNDYERVINACPKDTLKLHSHYAVEYNSQGQLVRLIIPYLETMDFFYQTCHHVLCRAGATTIAELLSFNTPSILIPYPYAKDNHQYYNALAIQKMNMATLLTQDTITFDTVLDYFNTHTHKLTTSYSARETVSKLIKSLLS